MQEHILAAIIRRDEAEAAHLVEPLHRAIDGIGRPALVAATAAIVARRSTIAAKATTWRPTEVTPRRTVTEATARRSTEITARRTIAEASTRRSTEIAARRTVTEATARRPAEAAARRPIAEVTAWRPIAKATGPVATRPVATRPVAKSRAVTTTRRGRPARPELPLDDAGDKTPALAVRPDFTHELVTGLGRLDAGFGQGRGVEEDILAIRPKDETEALAAIVPLDFGFDGRSAALVIFGKHVLSYPYLNASPDGMLGRYCEAWHRPYEKASGNQRNNADFAP